MTDLDTFGDGGAVGGLGAGGFDGLVEQVLKVHAALLETGSVHVRQVVGDGVDVHLLGYHARRCGEQ